MGTKKISTGKIILIYAQFEHGTHVHVNDMEAKDGQNTNYTRQSITVTGN